MVMLVFDNGILRVNKCSHRKREEYLSGKEMLV